MLEYLSSYQAVVGLAAGIGFGLGGAFLPALRRVFGDKDPEAVEAKERLSSMSDSYITVWRENVERGKKLKVAEERAKALQIDCDALRGQRDEAHRGWTQRRDEARKLRERIETLESERSTLSFEPFIWTSTEYLPASTGEWAKVMAHSNRVRAACQRWVDKLEDKNRKYLTAYPAWAHPEEVSSFLVEMKPLLEENPLA